MTVTVAVPLAFAAGVAAQNATTTTAPATPALEINSGDTAWLLTSAALARGFQLVESVARSHRHERTRPKHRLAA